MEIDENVIARFETKFEKGDGCWEWLAGKSGGSGYGAFGMMLPGKSGYMVSVQAHRAAWMIYCGPIPEGMCVCHHCDNPGCVNPDHLFLGTRKDNTQDMIAKGRHIEGARIRGERLRGRKMPDEQKAKIRAAHLENPPRSRPVVIDGVSYRNMAEAGRALGVTRQAIFYRVTKGAS